LEINDVLLILGVFIPVFLVAIWQLNRMNPAKKGVKAADSSIKELFSVHNSQVTEVLKLKDRAISSLQARIRNYEQEDEPQEDDPKDNQVKFEDIEALIKKSYPQYAKALMIPGAKQWIKKQTRGMSLDEVLTMVEELTGKKIAAGGKSELSTSEENQPGYF